MLYNKTFANKTFWFLKDCILARSLIRVASMRLASKKSDLVWHGILHCGGRPWKCSTCQKSTRKSDLGSMKNCTLVIGLWHLSEDFSNKSRGGTVAPLSTKLVYLRRTALFVPNLLELRGTWVLEWSKIAKKFSLGKTHF